MEFKTIPGVTLPVARLIQGTTMIGSDHEPESYALLDGVLAAGGNTFDTAHGYGEGKAERTLGRWLQSRGVRDRVVVITKGAHYNQDRQRVTPYDISSDLFDSLARLQTDHIDLYLLHRDNPDVPVGELVDVLNEHLVAGRIHAFGGSNWSPVRLQKANQYASDHGLVPFVASSPHFSLAEPTRPAWPGCITLSGARQEAARSWYASSGMALLPWSSLSSGFFSGRFRRDNLDTFQDYWDQLCVEVYCTEPNFQRLDRAQQLAREKGSTVSQIALAYLLHQPLNVFPLVGCRTAAEYQENAASLALALTPAEIAWLNLDQDSPN